MMPVLANTGVNEDNVEQMLEVADGAIVGTGFKVDRYIWNPVDPERARRLVARVHAVRERLIYRSGPGRVIMWPKRLSTTRATYTDRIAASASSSTRRSFIARTCW